MQVPLLVMVLLRGLHNFCESDKLTLVRGRRVEMCSENERMH